MPPSSGVMAVTLPMRLNAVENTLNPYAPDDAPVESIEVDLLLAYEKVDCGEGWRPFAAAYLRNEATTDGYIPMLMVPGF